VIRVYEDFVIEIYPSACRWAPAETWRLSTSTIGTPISTTLLRKWNLCFYA